jgi:amino-acid N-acetyltransferase
MSTTVALREAGTDDVAAIQRLITDNLVAGHLLPRTAEDIEQHAARFFVAVTAEGEVVGCAELAPLSAEVAEVRSLVVEQGHRGRHIGSDLVARLASTAAARGFAELCAFTHEPATFVRMGFTLVPHVWVPEKIEHDCRSCALFRHCGQYAVMLTLRAGHVVRPERPAAIVQSTRPVAPRRPAGERLETRAVRLQGRRVPEAVPA